MCLTLFVFLLPVLVQCEKPNILFILSDDQGYSDVGWKDKTLSTPVLDKLAKGGVILDSHYVMPICAPTRASFLTGRHAISNGYWYGNPSPSDQVGLGLDEYTIADMLKSYGYATHAIGKWHLGMYSVNHTPALRGFNSFLGMYLGAGDYYSHTNSGAYDFRLNYVNKLTKEVDDYLLMNFKGLYSTEIFTNWTIELLHRHKRLENDKPFFLYLNYQTPHGPLHYPPKRYDEPKKVQAVPRQKYSSMISYMDKNIGNIIDTLELLGYRKNTLVIFSSDNGAEIGKFPGSNAPFRGGKRSFWEGGVRSLCFINSPLLKKSGYTNTNIHHIMDWFPTFEYLASQNSNSVELTRTESGSQRKRIPGLQGVNIWTSISRNTAARKAVSQ